MVYPAVSAKLFNNESFEQEITLYQLYRVEMEDLSASRKHNFKYVYAENETDALIEVLDSLDVRVAVKGIPHKAEPADLIDAAEEFTDQAPLSKMRRWL